MLARRNKFLTFLFSMLPGAGHMYLGFMKLGVSFLGSFFAIIFLSSWLDLGPLMYLLPVLWFYAFFDCLNRTYMPDQEFVKLQDRYLFSLDKLAGVEKGLNDKSRLLLGIGLAVVGVLLLGRSMFYLIGAYIPQIYMNAFYDLWNKIPQFLIGILIVVVGIWLIAGRKKEMQKDE